MSEIGESLVASWYQHIGRMILVVESMRLERQGELDDLAVRGTHVLGAEGATHILDLNNGKKGLPPVQPFAPLILDRGCGTLPAAQIGGM